MCTHTHTPYLMEHISDRRTRSNLTQDIYAWYGVVLMPYYSISRIKLKNRKTFFFMIKIESLTGYICLFKPYSYCKISFPHIFYCARWLHDCIYFGVSKFKLANKKKLSTLLLFILLIFVLYLLSPEGRTMCYQLCPE